MSKKLSVEIHNEPGNTLCILNILFPMIQKHQFLNKEIYLGGTFKKKKNRRGRVRKTYFKIDKACLC